MTVQTTLDYWQTLYQAFKQNNDPISTDVMKGLGDMTLFYQQFKNYFQIHGVPDLKLESMFDLSPVTIMGESYQREKLYQCWLDQLPKTDAGSLGHVIAVSFLNALRGAKPYNLNQVESITLKNIVRNLVGLSHKDQDYPLRRYVVNKHRYILLIKNSIALLVEGTLDDLSIKAVCLGSFVTTIFNGRDLAEARSMPWVLDFEQKLVSMSEVQRKHTRLFKSETSHVPELKGFEDHAEYHIPHHEWIISASDTQSKRGAMFLNRERWEGVKHFFI